VSPTISDHDDAESGTSSLAVAETHRHFVHVVRNLWNQDHVGSAGDAAVERNPPGVAAHHFDNHDPAMGFGRGVQSIDRIGCEVDSRIESETARRPDDVVVDRLRDADERYAHLVELVRDGERAVAADAYQRVERHLAEHLEHPLCVVERALGRNDRLGKRIAAIHRPEDRSSEPQNAGDIARSQRA